MTFDELQNEFLILKARVDAYERGDRFLFSKTQQILDGRNIQLGRTTGTVIGTATDQKLGFFGKAPVAQQSAISTPGGGATVDTQARSAITSLIAVLHNFGFTA
jgi:hypothetical protein